MVLLSRCMRYCMPPDRLSVTENHIQQRAQLLLEAMQLPDDEQEL